jgi:hypothetical protein
MVAEVTVVETINEAAERINDENEPSTQGLEEESSTPMKGSEKLQGLEEEKKRELTGE